MPSAGTKKFGMAEFIFLLSVLILVVIVALPVVLIFWTSFIVDGHLNMKAVMDTIMQEETFQALKMSIMIAACVTVTCTFVGTLFAWLVTRTDLPFKETMKVLFTVPFMLPAFIGALAWKMLLSPRAGYINQLWMAITGTRHALFNIYGFWGIVIIETMYLFPFVFIQVSGALERMDPTLEESARISGAGLFTITRKITIPLIMPAVVAGALLVCLYSLSHFGTPAILGTEVGIYTIPTMIYELIHQSAGSFTAIRAATVLSVVLVLSAAVILYAQNKVIKSGRFQIIAGKSVRPTVLKLRGLRTPLFIFCCVYLLITVVMPTVTIFLVGFLNTYGLPLALENMSWENYRYVLFEWKLTKDAIWNSAYLSLSAAFVTMIAGGIISYVLVKLKVRGKWFLEFLGMLPFSLPGTVIALGVILTWSGRFGINLYNTAWIIFVAYIARYMAFSLKSNSAALEQVHDSLVEASRASGATPWQSLRDIVIPLIRPGMVAAFFLIFLPALRELTTSVLLYGPTTRTIGVAIYTLNEDGETVYACALAGIALLLIVGGEILIKRFFEKKRRADNGGA
ncbi:ABC transporter permease [Cloacibacillus porcorum]|uniref:ABC transporter permease n=1 Tax=Cloacibacillus porcorum TaxID=1197717 RepID=A0A1B2I6R0_9BACT|nr:iron ABC transporter permease [Cloacibacillus porcorum]ANZ45650.1 ABC transporter permease [Cloacibacillus porcorum]MCC8183768.1 iron ABC transporter permease [Cloacibacillus porcorum]MCD8393044.1 iron ABC transporter permease [Cloacibacillus porcorum]MCI5865374.1 iron ABC transporter permease [Cloacibacillus porcorum]MDD7650560.1 iron ABC transporter permease [Cloacibacillus porcorum]